MSSAFLMSWTSPRIFRATTYVLISESKIDAAAPNSPWEFAFLPTYLQFVSSDDVGARVVSHFHLDRAPYRLTPHRFIQNCLDVQIPKNTRLLQIDVEFPDARMAADLANYVAQSATGANTELSATETASTQRFLKTQLDQASAHLSETEAKNLEVQRRAQIEDREARLKILLNEKEQVSNQTEQLTLALTQFNERARSIAASLGAQPAKLQLKKSIESDRFLEHAAEQLLPDGTRGLSATEEALNPTRQELDRELIEARANADADRAEIESAGLELVRIDAAAAQALDQLQAFRAEVATADQDLKLAREGYESTTRDYRNASLTVGAKSQDLKQVAPAMPPESPVRPRILLDTAMAGILGAAVLSGIAMILHSLRQTQTLRLSVRQPDAPLVRTGEY
jgi:capsular polysaccharide biosynthesis protein